MFPNEIEVLLGGQHPSVRAPVIENAPIVVLNLSVYKYVAKGAFGTSQGFKGWDLILYMKDG